MVLHYLSERPRPAGSRAVPATVPPSGARAGFVVGKAVGNSVIRHRVTRRLRAVVGAELHRLPPTADLVVRARPDAASATSETLHRDLSAGLDRLLSAHSSAQRSPAS
jgi:ribonuclease P protein component